MRFIWPWQDRNRKFSWLKASAFFLVLAPGLYFSYEFATNEFGMLPIAFGNMTYWSGVWATVVLVAALAVTPAIHIFRWPALVDTRRMIGVAALVYTLVHVVFFFGLRSWNFAVIGSETVTRLTLVVATLSTLGLIVLGATSLDAAIRRMGVKGWQRLHNTNYWISGLAVLHVVLARGTYAEQYLLTGMFFWVMAWRLLARYRLGTDLRALALLAVTSSLLTALFEAAHVWVRRGYELSWTLANNFNPDLFEIAIPPIWQVLAYASAIALAAAANDLFRVRTAGRTLAARQARPAA